MYLQEIPKCPLTTTLVQIKYDCCGKEHTLKWKDADKNFQKNNGKHICRTCWLKSNNPAKNDKVKQKVKQTNIERYGTATPLNLPENLEKRKQLFEDTEFVKKRAEKHKQTCIKKYGVEHHMHTDELKEKVKQTNIEKYGVVAPLQNPEILAKAQATNLERYGNICSLNDPEVKAKALKSLFEHYGVEYYNQLPEMKDYLRENCRDWLKESWANPWAKGITRPEEWNAKQSATMTKLLLEGKLIATYKGSIRGYYRASKCKKSEPFFRSHLELIMHFHLDESDNIEFYDYEPFAIDYMDSNGNIRKYVPDFLAKYKDDNVVKVIETKPEYMLNKKDNPIKAESMEKFSAENGLEFIIYTEKYLHKLRNYKELVMHDKVKILV